MSIFFKQKKSIAFAELNISGTDIDPQKISDMLNLPICSIRQKGDYRTQQDNTVCVAYRKDVTWTYKTQEQPTLDLGDRLRDLQEIFEQKAMILQQIKSMFPSCTIDVCIVLYNRQKILPGMSLTDKQIKFLAQIGAMLDYDIYHRLWNRRWI